MAPQRVSFRYQWMFEILGWRIPHSELFHHPTRLQVGSSRERDNLLQAHPLEPVSYSFVRGLGRISFSPFIGAESPCYLNTRGECQSVPWNGQSYKPDKLF